MGLLDNFLQGGEKNRNLLRGLLSGDIESLKNASQSISQLFDPAFQQSSGLLEKYNEAMEQPFMPKLSSEQIMNNPGVNAALSFAPIMSVTGKIKSPLWIDELVATGKKLNPDGTLTVFHRTNPNSAQLILKTGKMTGKEDGLFFSTIPNGQATGYGDSVIKMNIPANKLQLDDIFKDEAHFRLPLNKIGDVIDVSKWISKD